MALFSKPLKNIKVLDFTRLIPGPFCTKILSDLGADVIKIEDLNRGDYVNAFAPHVFGKESVLNVYFNKNKKRFKLDCKNPAGQDVILKLVKKADVLVESFRPGVMKTMGLDYAKLKKINSKLVYASITGFGQDGALAHKAGHDLNFLAVSGLMTLHDKVPQYQLGDFVAGGFMATFAIQSALMERARTRQGRYLDVSMTEGLSFLAQHLHFSAHAVELGAIQGVLARYQIYVTSDGKRVALAAFEEKFWQKFCDLLHRPDWKTAGHEPARNASLIQELRREFATRTANEWRKFAEEHDVCLTMESDKGDLRRLGLLKSVEVACEGEKLKFEETSLFGGAPKQSYARSGQHNVTILKSFGFTAKQIADLKKQGVI